MSVAHPEMDVDQEIFVIPDTPWQVVVSNDPVNLISVVAQVFHKVLGVSKETAMEYTLKVHKEGRCAVFSGTQEDCEAKAEVLMSYQLWTHVEKSGAQ